MRSGSVLKPLLKIGELSKQTQVGVGTLRYYESLGLLLPAQRGHSGYRYYAAESVEQVYFIQKAQALGFSLPEVQHILGVRVIGASRRVVLKQLLDDKITVLTQEIQRLTAFKGDLESYQSHCTEVEIPKEEYVQGLLKLINRVSLAAIAPIEQSA
jgi:DNA-binding transcriptional MerR regulator